MTCSSGLEAQPAGSVPAHATSAAPHTSRPPPGSPSRTCLSGCWCPAARAGPVSVCACTGRQPPGAAHLAGPELGQIGQGGQRARQLRSSGRQCSPSGQRGMRRAAGSRAWLAARFRDLRLVSLGSHGDSDPLSAQNCTGRADSVGSACSVLAREVGSLCRPHLGGHGAEQGQAGEAGDWSCQACVHCGRGQTR